MRVRGPTSVLAAGKPSRHIDPLHHHRRPPPARQATNLVGHEGEVALRHGGRDRDREYGKGLFVLHRVNPFTTIPSFRIEVRA